MSRITDAMVVCDRVSYHISRAAAVISGILISLVTIMVFAYIVNRAFIGKIWLFVEEWTSLSLVPIAYLGMGYTLRWNRHLFIDVLTRKFNRKKRDTIAIAVTVFSLLVLAFMIERSLDWFAYTINQEIRSTGPMRSPMWIFSGSMFGGLCVYTLDMVFCLFSEILKKADSKVKLRFFDE